MQCERLIKQIKGWYIHVSNETMAPARMVSFIQKHADECEICLDDPDLQEEIEKITELILPESKIPKAVRMQQEQAEQEKRAAANEDPVEEVAEDETEDETETETKSESETKTEESDSEEAAPTPDPATTDEKAEN